MSSRTSTAVSSLIILLVVLTIAFPILYAVTVAFSPGLTITQAFSQLLAEGPSLENFRRALRRAPLVQQMGNSAVVTICQTFLQVITSVCAAYAIVFGRLRRPNLWFGLVLLTMMIPTETTIIANYLTIQSLGLYDTSVAVFLPYIANAAAIFLLRQAFSAFPFEIWESAALDGVGPIRFLVQFLVPLNRPIIAAVTIVSAIGAWNGFLWPLLITDSPNRRTVQAGIAQMADSVGPDTGALLAGAAFISIPMILLVIIGQSALTKGLTEGAVK